MVITLAFVNACASFKISNVQKVAREVAAQNSGYMISKKYPEIGNAILEYSKPLLEAEDISEVDFHKWAGYLIDKLADDPFLNMNFKKLIELVEVDLNVSEEQKLQSKIIIDVVSNICLGIESAIGSL